MSSSNCCFLTHIQVSQETVKVVWYSHLFKNFCFNPHSQRLLHSQWSRSIFFCNSFAFSMISQMLAIWTLDFSASLKPSLYIWNFLVRILLKPSLKDIEHNLDSVYNKCIVQYFEHSLSLPFFGIGIQTDLFQSCGHCWVFQIYWHTQCSTLTASSLDFK